MSAVQNNLNENQKEEILHAIEETLCEVRRINEAHGETVFNPAATQALLAAAGYLVSCP